MVKSRAFIVVLVLLSTILGGTAGAQDSEACPVLVNRALSHVGNNCASMDRNSVCYGFEDVSALFTDESQLLHPADRAELSALASLKTMPFDEATEKWGISVLNLQANLPNTLPGQSVRVLLLGDVRIEEETEPSQVLVLPEEAIEVTPKADETEVFAAPLDYGVTALETVAQVDADEMLLADGLSPTGQWVRITLEFATEYGTSATSWVYREDLTENPALDSLPTIGPASYTPMQAFYFTSGVGEAACNELPPSGVLIQGPEEYEVTIRANSAEIRINSTVLLQTSEDGESMTLTPLSGIARVNPGTPEEMLVPTGYSASTCLDGPYNLGIADDENDYVIGVDCAWALDNGLTQEDLSPLVSFETIPDNISNYTLDIPEQVCASGVGGVICEYRYGDPDFLNILGRLCALGLIDEAVCETVAPGVQVSEAIAECEAIAEQVHAGLGSNCADLGEESVCYGYDGMVASFTNAEALQIPADRASVRNFVVASTEGFDSVQNRWGILALNARADLPNTFAEGSVRSVLFGEGMVENGVQFDTALLLPEEPVEVTVADDTAIVLNLPDTFGADSRVVGEVPVATVLLAEAITEDGQWARITFAYETDYGFIQTAWIQRSTLEDNPDLDALPVMGPDSRTPMQSTFFSLSSTVPRCGPASPTAQIAYYLIQGPADVEISQTINGAEIRINGTVLLQAFPVRRFMRLTTVSGLTRVRPGSNEEILIPAGYSAITCMDGPLNSGADGNPNDYVASDRCDWHLSEPLTEAALAALGADAIPGGLLNYPVSKPQLVCDEMGCDYVDTNPVYARRLGHLCEEGLLSPSICRFIES